MWNLKYDTDEVIYKNRNRLIDIETNLRLPKGIVAVVGEIH